MGMFALFDAKNCKFFKIYGVSARTRGEGVEPVWTICGQGGSICADILYGQPLIRCSYDIQLRLKNSVTKLIKHGSQQHGQEECCFTTTMIVTK